MLEPKLRHTVYNYFRNNNFLAEYDKFSGQLKRTWKFQNQVTSIYGSSQGRYIFANTSDGLWIVDLGGSN